MAVRLRERRWRGGTLLRSLLIALGVGALLGRIGPFDTFSELPWVSRYAYWIGLTLAMWLQIEAAARLLAVGRTTRRWSWLSRAIFAGLAGALPTAFEVAWAESLMRVERDLGLFDLLAIYGDVVLLAVPFALLLAMLDRGAPSPAEAAQRHNGADGEGADPLLARLPPHLRGPLVAVASEDHYLRVYTDRGDTLIHQRFGDAVGALGQQRGLRVHRSWWVAQAAVQGSERDGDRLHLLLSNGLRVPVSRTYLMAVRAAGFAS